MFSFKSSHRRCSVKRKRTHVNTCEHMCWSLFLIQMHDFRTAILLKRDSNKGTVKFVKFLGTSFWRMYANDCFCSLFLMAPVLKSLFNKVASLQTCNFIKRRLQHRCFSCKIWEIFKNTYFEEYLRTTASVVSFSWLYVHYLRHRFINQK